jgi:hypothetical protein
MLDMKMVVRFEVDACLSTDAGPAKTTSTGGASDTNHLSKKTATSTSVDDLADALGSMDLKSRPAPANTTKGPTTINVVRAGTQVPQDALIEVTSRSRYFVDQLDWNELYPQLALSHTPLLYLGVHDRGTFTQLREWRVHGPGSDSTDSSMPDLVAQRKKMAVQIVQLARVLEDVQELAISRGPGPAGRFSLVCQGGSLRVYGRNSDDNRKTCLPPDVMERFVGEAL